MREVMNTGRQLQVLDAFYRRERKSAGVLLEVCEDVGFASARFGTAYPNFGKAGPDPAGALETSLGAGD